MINLCFIICVTVCEALTWNWTGNAASQGSSQGFNSVLLANGAAFPVQFQLSLCLAIYSSLFIIHYFLIYLIYITNYAINLAFTLFSKLFKLFILPDLCTVLLFGCSSVNGSTDHAEFSFNVEAPQTATQIMEQINMTMQSYTYTVRIDHWIRTRLNYFYGECPITGCILDYTSLHLASLT